MKTTPNGWKEITANTTYSFVIEWKARGFKKEVERRGFTASFSDRTDRLAEAMFGPRGRYWISVGEKK
jgi:hypothetical protein